MPRLPALSILLALGACAHSGHRVYRSASLEIALDEAVNDGAALSVWWIALPPSTRAPLDEGELEDWMLARWRPPDVPRASFCRVWEVVPGERSLRTRVHRVPREGLLTFVLVGDALRAAVAAPGRRRNRLVASAERVFVESAPTPSHDTRPSGQDCTEDAP